MSLSVSPAIVATVIGLLPALERPVPRLSNSTTRRPAPIRCTSCGSHASMVPPSPMIITTGGPRPIER
jgi:hypothetical protein